MPLSLLKILKMCWFCFEFFEQNSLFDLPRPSFHKKQDQGEGTKVRSTPCASKSSLASLIRSLAEGKSRRFGQQIVGHLRRRVGEAISEHIKAKNALKNICPRGRHEGSLTFLVAARSLPDRPWKTLPTVKKQGFETMLLHNFMKML